MRACIATSVYLTGILAFGLAATGQQPPPDRDPERAQPRDAPRPDGERRARSGAVQNTLQRPRTDSPAQPVPEGGPRGMSGGFSRGSAGQQSGFGGGGGRGGGGGGFGGGGIGMPGPGMMPGGYGAFAGEPDDPEMREIMKQDADLERQAHELAARVRQASGEQRTELRKQLADLVNKHFDVRQQRRELQLKRMEVELKRLREAISQRNDSRETVVGNRITELVGPTHAIDF